MQYNKIDTSILPKAWLHWTTTKASFWVDCENNIKSNERPDIRFTYGNQHDVCFNSGSKPLWAYAKYHEDIDMLEVTELWKSGLNMGRGAMGEFAPLSIGFP